MTLDELRTYLAEMTELAHKYDVEANAESIAARMWKRLTPSALTFWTVPGVLEHIGECLTPPITQEDEDE
jgi:hypothetical protein